MEKNIDYNKEFNTGFQEYTIARGDYESMPCPMKTSDFDDEKMQKLADIIGAQMKLYNFDEESPDYEDDVEDAFWREMEECAVAMGMTYYEDEVDEEEIKPMIVSRLATIMETSDAEAIADVISFDVAQDVSETADPQSWNSGDVDIAIVRVLKKKLSIEE